MTISVGNLIVAGGATVDTSEVLSALNKQGLKVWVGTKTQRDALPENIKNDDKITFLTYDSEEDIYLIIDTIISYSKTWSSVKISTELAKKINSSDVYTKTEVMQIINSKVASALKYRGAVATVAALPSSGQENGDSYYVQADGYMYAWSSDYSDWQALGSATDMTNYYTKTEVDALLADMAVKFQYNVMPTADSTTVGKIIQYTGADTNDYKNGYWYKGVDNGDSTYSWIIDPAYYTSDVVDALHTAKYYNAANAPDCDTLTEIYVLVNAGNSYVENHYPAQDLFFVKTIYSDTDAFQTAIAYGAIDTTQKGVMYSRVKTSGVWSSWKKLATTDWVSANNYVKHTDSSLSAAGWYKIAKLTPSNYASSIIVKLTSTYNYFHNAAVTFVISNADTSVNCTVLSKAGYDAVFAKARVINDYVEIYYDAQGTTNSVDAIIMISENAAGQTQIENFVADSTETGGTEWILNSELATISTPQNGWITITSVVGDVADATTTYRNVGVGDLVNVQINSGVSFIPSWWGTVNGLSSLGITHIQNVQGVSGECRILARVCKNIDDSIYLDFLRDSGVATKSDLGYAKFPTVVINSTQAIKITRNSVASGSGKYVDVFGNVFMIGIGDQLNRFYVTRVVDCGQADITTFARDTSAMYIYSNTYQLHFLELLGDLSYEVIAKSDIPAGAETATIP